MRVFRLTLSGDNPNTSLMDMKDVERRRNEWGDSVGRPKTAEGGEFDRKDCLTNQDVKHIFNMNLNLHLSSWPFSRTTGAMQGLRSQDIGIRAVDHHPVTPVVLSPFTNSPCS
jgi:hypothetical protein